MPHGFENNGLEDPVLHQPLKFSNKPEPKLKKNSRNKQQTEESATLSTNSKYSIFIAYYAGLPFILIC